MLALEVGYPSLDEEKRIVAETPRITAAANEVQQVVTREELLRFADAVWRMPVSEHVVDYAVRLARATRPGDAEAPGAAREPHLPPRIRVHDEDKATRRVMEGCDPATETLKYKDLIGTRALVTLLWTEAPAHRRDLVGVEIPVHVTR